MRRQKWYTENDGETITASERSLNNAIRNYVMKITIFCEKRCASSQKLDSFGTWSMGESVYVEWLTVKQSQCWQSCEIARRRSRKYAPDYADRSSHVLALSAFEESPSSEKARALRLHRRHVLHLRLQRGDQWEGKPNDILSRFILGVQMWMYAILLYKYLDNVVKRYYKTSHETSLVLIYE